VHELSKIGLQFSRFMSETHLVHQQ